MDKYRVWKKTGGKCWYCGKQTYMATVEDVEQQKAGSSNDWFSIDHILPQIAGGTDGIDNLLPACMGCNRKKRERTIEEYRSALSRKLAGAPKFTKEQVEYLRQHGIEIPIAQLPLVVFWGEKNHE